MGSRRVITCGAGLRLRSLTAGLKVVVSGTELVGGGRKRAGSERVSLFIIVSRG